MDVGAFIIESLLLRSHNFEPNHLKLGTMDQGSGLLVYWRLKMISFQGLY